MKWKEKTLLYKVIDVLMVLSAMAFVVLAVLKKMDVAVHESLSKCCFSVTWLCMGVSYWKTNRTLVIIYCGLSAVWLLLALLYLF